MASGPPPNPNSRRQQSQSGEWTVLPADGRAGRAPAWPLTPPLPREQEVWAAVWRTPQAVEWERLRWFHDVGLYVRFLVAGESTSATALRAAAEARQWSDRLGLSPASLLRLRWRIVPDEPVAPVVPDAATTDPRRRLRVVGDDDDVA